MGSTRHRMESFDTSNMEHLKLLYVSTSKYEGDWQSILHAHPFSELFYVVSGNGFFVADDREFAVEPNDMVIINPHVEHTEKSMSTSPLEYIVLGIDGFSFSYEDISSAQNVLAIETASGSVFKYRMPNSNVYAYLNIMLGEISHKEKNYERVCRNLLEVLLICMLRDSNLSMVRENNTILNRECTRIKNYLDSSYAEDITLDKLAAMTHMNKYYMVHAFTKYTGLSPINYVIQRRIQEGKSLLEATDYSVAQISSMVGFSFQSYFSQSFKKMTGMTPIQYRNAYKQKIREKSRGFAD